MNNSTSARFELDSERIGFYASTGLVVLTFTGLWLFEGYYVVTAWFPALYDEVTPINGVAAGAFMTLMLSCSLATMVRPRAAIGPGRVLLIGTALLGVLVPIAYVLTEPLVTVVGILATAGVLGLLVRFHPARTELVPSRVSDPDWTLVGLAVAISVPFVWLAADYQWLQLTLDDGIADRWFYGGLSMYLLATSLLAAASSVDGTTRRWTAGSAAGLAGLLGLVSVVYPAELHSLGLVGGTLVLVWAGCVGALVLGRN